MRSRRALLPKLMKNWEERVFGPAVANVSFPRVFEAIWEFTLSSWMRAFFQMAATLGSPWIPN